MFKAIFKQGKQVLSMKSHIFFLFFVQRCVSFLLHFVEATSSSYINHATSHLGLTLIPFDTAANARLAEVSPAACVRTYISVSGCGCRPSINKSILYKAKV